MKNNKIFELIELEKVRQRDTLMLIPSENYTYPEVREAVGSVLMHKYAEGQPGKRYYQGMNVVDEIEKICEQNALEAFGLNPAEWAVNVQAYSGTPANLAVYNAILEPGDKIMSMFLPDGGHLSHGWEYAGKKVTFVSKIWDVQFYHVESDSRVFDYDKIEKQALEFKPKLIISGGTAYPREIDYKKMSEIAKKVGAYYLADIAHEAGLVAGGSNSSPFPYADFVTMTTHKTLRGPRGALIFSRKEFETAIDSSIFPGLQGGPHIHTIAGIAIALEKTKLPEFKEYAIQTVENAKYLADLLIKGGLDVVSGGTDKHLILVDLRTIGANGWTIGWALEKAGIIANRNTVPNESASPFYPSGLRLGTPAITVRGMKEEQMDLIAKWLMMVIEHVKDAKIPEDKQSLTGVAVKDERIKFTKDYLAKIENDKLLLDIALQVKELCVKFPTP
jgi:glycine hydroxymethyltransferase